jgi:hypothetical protein
MYETKVKKQEKYMFDVCDLHLKILYMLEIGSLVWKTNMRSLMQKTTDLTWNIGSKRAGSKSLED